TTPDIKALEEKYAAQKASIETEYENKLKTMSEEVKNAQKLAEAANAQLRGQIKATTIAELRAKYGLTKLAEDVLDRRIDVVPEQEGSNRMVARVFENGEPSYKAGNFKTPEQLVEELREIADFSGMFVAGTAGGSGAPSHQRTGGAGGGIIRVSREASKTNPSLYQQAKAEAAKTGAKVEFID